LKKKRGEKSKKKNRLVKEGERVRKKRTGTRKCRRGKRGSNARYEESKISRHNKKRAKIKTLLIIG
jgi:hypothetical protein